MFDFRALAIGALALAVSACSGGAVPPTSQPAIVPTDTRHDPQHRDTPPTASPLPTPSPTASPFQQHLYLTGTNGSGVASISSFSIFGKNGQTPQPNGNVDLSVPTIAPVAIAVDRSGDVAVAQDSGAPGSYGWGQIAYYAGAATLQGTFANGRLTTATGLAFTSNGNLFATNGATELYRYTAPYSNSTQAIQAYAYGSFPKITGLASDANDNLYVSNADYGSNQSSLGEIGPDYFHATLTQTAIAYNTLYTQLATSQSYLFAVTTSTVVPRIDAYALPLVSGETRSFSLYCPSNPGYPPEGVAVDGQGNLYTTCGTFIEMFPGPITASSKILNGRSTGYSSVAALAAGT